MGYLAGVLLLHMGEEDTFWMMVMLLTDAKYDLRGLFVEGMPKLNLAFHQLNRCMEMFVPKLTQHLVGTDREEREERGQREGEDIRVHADVYVYVYMPICRITKVSIYPCTLPPGL